MRTPRHFERNKKSAFLNDGLCSCKLMKIGAARVKNPRGAFSKSNFFNGQLEFIAV